ncbi:hypothetical protein ACNPKB_10555 [Shewanella marisflavi]|uniref:hypothetical protein n=1 Tax=Shewanella marisflavi TaxID=260364 RepID=UPI003AAF920C
MQNKILICSFAIASFIYSHNLASEPAKEVTCYYGECFRVDSLETCQAEPNIFFDSRMKSDAAFIAEVRTNELLEIVKLREVFINNKNEILQIDIEKRITLLVDNIVANAPCNGNVATKLKEARDLLSSSKPLLIPESEQFELNLKIEDFRYNSLEIPVGEVGQCGI